MTQDVRPLAALGRYLLMHIVLVPALLACAALAMHASGWDLAVATRFFDATRHDFPWRGAVWLEVLGHHLLKLAPIGVCVVAVGLAVGSYLFPRWRPLRRPASALAVALALGPAAVTLLKSLTVAHCPWDLAAFGGYASYAADYAGSWWAASPAEAGRCLPSGHAGAGFSLLALYFFGCSAGRPRWAWGGLGVGAAAGLVFGAVRVVQGAHFPSHVVWSAAVCWMAAALVNLLIVGPESDQATRR
jgi:membrane-associated PAP2 superfamily phosphatase